MGQGEGRGMSITIWLNNEEAMLADTVADRRQAQAVKRGIPEQKRSKLDGLTIHRIGAWAEVAIGMLFGKGLTVDDLVKSNPDNIVRKEDIVHAGHLIDVKGSLRKDNDLNVYVPKKAKPSTAYLHCHVNFAEGFVVAEGWATKEEVFMEENYVKKYHKYQLPRNKFRPVIELMLG